MERRSTPPSREVRLANRLTQGWAEDYLYQAHRGATSDLVGLMAKAELQIQYERSQAAEAIGVLLIAELARGPLTPLTIHQALRHWHEAEALNEYGKSLM